MKTKRLLLLLGSIWITFFTAYAGYDSAPQTQHSLNEAQTVYLGNLARRDNGLPPLRWNRQLSQAARWFSWDSVENRPAPYCGHQDTQGNWPDYRTRAFGYLGLAGAENAFCGYVTPQYAVDGWMNSPGHRANLLDPNSREVGIGYYRRESDGRGYVTQDFGADPAFPPVIIENEAITVTSPAVNLYIYDRAAGGGFAEMGPATEMRISNEPCFRNAMWEPFSDERAWQLENGQGWRDVYVQTRDSLNRTVTVSDTVYMGSSAPPGEVSLAQAATTQDEITLYDLDSNGLPFAQLSLDWVVDDTYATFALNWGNGGRVNDPDAAGGTAFRLQPGGGEAYAWVWTTEFIKDTPFVAYARLKVSDNSSPNEVARFSINGGGVEYGPVSLRGVDFTAPDQYQEIMLPFTFHNDPDNAFLIFNFWRSGNTAVYVDAVYIFTRSMSAASPLTWTVPGGNYRGRGVWARYTDNNGVFSPITPVSAVPQGLSVAPTALFFMADAGGTTTGRQTIRVTAGCQVDNWQATGDAAWLRWQTDANQISVWVETGNLPLGEYTSSLTFSPDNPDIPPKTIPVTLSVVATLQRGYLPVIARLPSHNQHGKGTYFYP